MLHSAQEGNGCEKTEHVDRRLGWIGWVAEHLLQRESVCACVCEKGAFRDKNREDGFGRGLVRVDERDETRTSFSTIWALA